MSNVIDILSKTEQLAWVAILSFFFLSCESNTRLETSVDSQPNNSSKSNVIIIVLDTLRYDFTSLADETQNTTPFLSRLARRGIVFDNAYSTWDRTPESHFSIFTGHYRGLLSSLDTTRNSLPFHLKKVGYASLGISANGLVRRKSMKTVQSFERYYCPFFLRSLGDDWEKIPIKTRKSIVNNSNQLIDRYKAPRSRINIGLTRASATTVNSLLDVVIPETKEPMLLFLNFMDVHDPYFPGEEFYDLDTEIPVNNFSSDVRNRPLPEWMTNPQAISDPEKRENFRARLKNVKNRAWNLSDDLSPEALKVYRSRYVAEIKSLDQSLRYTFRVLERKNLLANSLVFITSDHGESFGEKGYITHSMQNEGDRESTRHVPLLVLLPRIGNAKGRRVKTPVSIADIAPTVYEFSGIDDSVLKEHYPDNYGKSLIGFFPGIEKHPTQYTIKLAYPENSNSDNSMEELLKSLKALGYIVDDEN